MRLDAFLVFVSLGSPFEATKLRVTQNIYLAEKFSLPPQSLSALRAGILSFRQRTSENSIIQGNNIMKLTYTITTPLTYICRITYIYVQLEKKATQLTEKLLSLQSGNKFQVNYKCLTNIHCHKNKKLAYSEMKVFLFIN